MMPSQKAILATSLAMLLFDGAGAASLGMGAAAGINTAPPGDTQTYSTFDAAEVASAHTVLASTAAFGATANGSIQGGAGHFSMNSFSSVVDPVANGCNTCSLEVVQESNSASYTDVLHLSSTTLAVGTPVDLLLTLTFSQSIAPSQALSVYLNAGYAAQMIANDQHADGAQLYTDGLGGQPDVTSAVLHTFIGQTINLSAAMYGGTYAEYIDQTARSVQASAGSDDYIDVMTAGATLSADTAHVYNTPPVPEPPALVLMLAGAVVVASAVRRRKAAD